MSPRVLSVVALEGCPTAGVGVAAGNRVVEGVGEVDLLRLRGGLGVMSLRGWSGSVVR